MVTLSGHRPGRAALKYHSPFTIHHSPSDLDENPLAIEKRHDAEPEEHRADGEHERGVDGRGPGGEQLFVDESEKVYALAAGPRELYERGDEHEEPREEVDGERVGAEDEERNRPAFVTLDVYEPVAEREQFERQPRCEDDV